MGKIKTYIKDSLYIKSYANIRYQYFYKVRNMLFKLLTT